MNKLCRLCGEKSENGTNIFDKSSSNLPIASTIDQLLGFEVINFKFNFYASTLNFIKPIFLLVQVSENDGLPTCICTSCQDFLNKVASFVDSCKKVQERLKILCNDFTCKEEREFANNDERDAFAIEIARSSDDLSVCNPERTIGPKR